MKVKNFMFSFVIIFTIWLFLNNSLEYQVLIIGLVVATTISFLFGRDNNLFSEIKLTPKSLVSIFIYFLIFLRELIKSNIQVAIIVVKPTISISPGIVKVRTKLKSRMGRMLLANSITLTPGTLTVDIKDEYLYIHWINVTDKDIDKATKEIVHVFERYLEVIYG